MPLEAGMLTKTVENAQKKVEEQNFLIRKRVLEYDDVMNEQRRVVYKYRGEILEGRDMSDVARDELEGVIERLVDEYTPGDDLEDWDLPELEVAAAPDLAGRHRGRPHGAGDGRPRKAQGRARRRRDERLRRARAAARRGADALPGALDPAAGDRQPLARAPLRHGLPARGHPPARLRPDRPARRLQKRGLRDVRGAHALDLGGVQQAGLPRRGRGRAGPGAKASSAGNGGNEPTALDYSGGTPEASPRRCSRSRPGAGGGGAEAAPEAAEAALGNGAPEPVETVVKDEHDKIGRNDPCWCGSGKKYKKCHGA